MPQEPSPRIVGRVRRFPAEAARGSEVLPPFDRARDGFVLAEDAAVLVLEEWERARARGTRVHAEAAGYATTNDAYHMTAPRPDGAQAQRCMALALEDAGVLPEQVHLVSAHASATPLGDRAEAQALARVFGDRAEARVLVITSRPVAPRRAGPARPAGPRPSG